MRRLPIFLIALGLLLTAALAPCARSSAPDIVHVYQFPYSTAPGTPPERLQILQQAFAKTLRDPELAAEAKKAQLEVDAIDGPTTAKTFAGLYELNPSLIAKLKELLVPKR